MKTKIFALTICLFLMVGSAVAKQHEKKNARSITSYIENSIWYPTFANDQHLEGVVNLLVELNENKELEIAQIWGSDPRLVKYVERRVKKLAKRHGTFDVQEEAKFIRIKFNLTT